MAERPRQHVLETESKKVFESVIPSEWNINYQHSDYGLDAKVQIFETGKSTPYFFFVQLKSTEEVKSKKIISYPFSNERLKEYQEYPLPVLLVLFDSKRKKLFCKWTHYFFDELVIKEKNELSHEGKTKVRFEQEFDKNFIECLFEEVKDYYFLTGKTSESSEEIQLRLDLNFEENRLSDRKSI